MNETKICPICDKAFAPHSNRQKYCGMSCAQKAKRKHDIAYNKKNAQKIKDNRLARVLADKVKVSKSKRRGLDLMTGEELLHYGEYQMRKYRQGQIGGQNETYGNANADRGA